MITYWHPQQLKLLKSWAELSSSFAFIHEKSYQSYKKKTLMYSLPVIVISTITGTASFALESIPRSFRPYAPPVIGFLNLTAGLITTISQFLKINSLSESYRITAQSFRMLSRNIAIELMLPADQRSMSSSKYVKYCREELDKLLESAPDLPVKFSEEFLKKYKNRKFAKPQSLEIPVFEVYSELDNQAYLEKMATEKPRE